MKGRIFSGIQPTGNLHIGNYLGHLKSWVKNQDDQDCIFCIVDLHAITVPQVGRVARRRSASSIAALYRSRDRPQTPASSSPAHVAAHAELAWILTCVIPVGWMTG